ncbi:hypothetical protein XENOCAPTIV_025786 [Xenoophorus captivus]|uniref:Ribonuclease A-domain domain-containing protein n=1 Tax=Xenoophorus captivus TaxID=1517983 RepID=A0ABV0RST9_9TELE
MQRHLLEYIHMSTNVSALLSATMSIFPVCLFVCLLLVQVVAPETTETDFQKFVRQHIIEAMDENDCTTVMANRNITKKVRTSERTETNETKGPKKINTFIIANENEVKAICHGQNGPEVRSANKFNIVVCKLTKEGRYEGTIKYYQIIEVKCENNLPVHFHDQIKGKG